MGLFSSFFTSDHNYPFGHFHPKNNSLGTDQLTLKHCPQCPPPLISSTPIPLGLQPIQLQSHKNTPHIMSLGTPRPTLSTNRHMIEEHQRERLEVATGRIVSSTAHPAGVVYWAPVCRVYVSRNSIIYPSSSASKLH